jgi:alpha-amylase
MHSRLGSREDLRQMIQTCRRHGVRVYADAVVNHMTGGGNDVCYELILENGFIFTKVDI